MIGYQVEHHGIITSGPHPPPSHRRTTHHLRPVLPHGSLSSDPGSRGGIYVSLTVDGTLCSSWFVWGVVILVGQRNGAPWCPTLVSEHLPGLSQKSVCGSPCRDLWILWNPRSGLQPWTSRIRIKNKQDQKDMD